MKKIVMVTTLCLVVFATGVTAQDNDTTMMKAWQSYMTPGQVHTMLAGYNGDWTEDITIWMGAGKPQQYKSSATTEMILGGRYQQSKTTGTMMGMPYEGMSLLGYDNAKKIFTNTWMDNMGTGTMTLEGVWNADTKSIEFKGTEVDPVTAKDIMVREVLKFTDNNNQQMLMYENRNGTENKVMEIKFSRKK